MLPLAIPLRPVYCAEVRMGSHGGCMKMARKSHSCNALLLHYTDRRCPKRCKMIPCHSLMKCSGVRHSCTMLEHEFSLKATKRRMNLIDSGNGCNLCLEVNARATQDSANCKTMLLWTELLSWTSVGHDSSICRSMNSRGMEKRGERSIVANAPLSFYHSLNLALRLFTFSIAVE